MLDLLRALTLSQRSAVGNGAIRDPNPPRVGVAFGHSVYAHPANECCAYHPLSCGGYCVPDPTIHN